MSLPNLPISPVHGEIYKNGALTYIYNQTTSSWDLLSRNAFNDIGMVEVLTLASSAIEGSVGYVDKAESSLILNVDRTFGSNSPANPIAGDSFKTLKQALDWARAFRFRDGMELTIQLFDGPHVIDSEIGVDLLNVDKLTIQGYLRETTISSINTIIRDINSSNEERIIEVVDSRFNRSRTTLVFSGEGRLNITAGNEIEIRALIAEASTQSTVKELIEVTSSTLLSFRNCYVTTAVDKKVSAFLCHEDCLSVEVDTCVFNKVALGSFEELRLSLNNTVVMAARDVGLVANCCSVSLVSTQFARCAGQVKATACQLFMISTTLLDSVSVAAIEAVSCLVNTTLLTIRRGVGPVFTCCGCMFGSYTGDTLVNNALTVINCTGSLTGSISNLRNSKPGLDSQQGGLRVFNSAFSSNSTTFSGNDGGGYSVAGGSRFTLSGARGEQATVGNVQPGSISGLGIMNS